MLESILAVTGGKHTRQVSDYNTRQVSHKHTPVCMCVHKCESKAALNYFNYAIHCCQR